MEDKKKPIGFKVDPYTPIVAQVEGADGQSYKLLIHVAIMNIFDKQEKDKNDNEQFEVSLNVTVNTHKIQP